MKKHVSPSLERQNISNVKASEILVSLEPQDARLHRRPGKMPISESSELASTTPDTQEMLILSKPLGLDPVRDKYLFSTMLELDTEMGGQSQVVINRSGCSLDDVPTPDEWHKAGVMNLSGNNFLSLDEGLDCPHLGTLFLQRNNGLSSSWYVVPPEK
ncbi:hypothetical protein ACS0TY_026242 [Phlomoides rotata]